MSWQLNKPNGRNSKGKFEKLRTIFSSLIFVTLLHISTAAIAEDIPEVGLCTNCSNAEFVFRAEQAAGFIPGIYPVYIVDTATIEVRFYEVAVWVDCGGNVIQGGLLGDNDRTAKEEFGVTSNCLHREVTQMPADGSIVDDIVSASLIVEEFYSPQNLTLNGENLANPIDSAADLLGPEGSPAAFRRAALKLDVRDHYATWWAGQAIEAGTTLERVVNKFVGNSETMSLAPFIRLDLSDGTSIDLKVISTQPNFDLLSTYAVVVEVLVDTARFPDGSLMPFEPGHFDEGFDHDFSDHPAALDGFLRALSRFGISNTGSGFVLACVVVDGGARVCHLLP